MIQNKFSGYFKYAVGEIILVMVGILLALQVNNWNETRKEQATARLTRLSLINELTADLDRLKKFRQNLEEAVLKHDALQGALTAPEVRNDEVVKLIQKKYVPWFPAYDGSFDSGYRSALASGSIAFLKANERKLLSELHALQEETEQTLTELSNVYRKRAHDLNAAFPFQISQSVFNSGPVYDEKWGNIDFDDLTTKFSAAATSKRLYYLQALYLSAELASLTEKVLNTLRE